MFGRKNNFSLLNNQVKFKFTIRVQKYSRRKLHLFHSDSDDFWRTMMKHFYAATNSLLTGPKHRILNFHRKKSIFKNHFPSKKQNFRFSPNRLVPFNISNFSFEPCNFCSNQTIVTWCIPRWQEKLFSIPTRHHIQKSDFLFKNYRQKSRGHGFLCTLYISIIMRWRLK